MRSAARRRLDLYLNRTHELNIEGLLLLFSLLTPSVLLWLKKNCTSKIMQVGNFGRNMSIGATNRPTLSWEDKLKVSTPILSAKPWGSAVTINVVIFRHFFSSFSYNQVQCYHNYNHNDNTFCLYAKKNTFIKYCKDINTENTQCANTCMCIWSTDPNKWYINKRMLVKPFIKICYRKKRLEIR